MYKFYNPNPKNILVEDCVVRALSKVQGQSWDDTFTCLTMFAYEVKDMPSSSRAWSKYLDTYGYERFVIPNMCPNCYTVRDFCLDNPIGTFLLVTDKHVIAVVNGDYFDTWDSGDEIPMYYWRRRNY